MKKSITAIIAAASILSFGAAAKVVPSDNSLPSKVCAAAANDDASKMRRLLKKENRNTRNAVRNIQCNGQPLEQFATDAHAIKVTRYFYPASNETTYIAKR